MRGRKRKLPENFVPAAWLSSSDEDQQPEPHEHIHHQQQQQQHIGPRQCASVDAQQPQVQGRHEHHQGPRQCASVDLQHPQVQGPHEQHQEPQQHSPQQPHRQGQPQAPPQVYMEEIWHEMEDLLSDEPEEAQPDVAANNPAVDQAIQNDPVENEMENTEGK